MNYNTITKASIASHLNILASDILSIATWAYSLYVHIKGIGYRFVSKNITPKLNTMSYRLANNWELATDANIDFGCVRQILIKVGRNATHNEKYTILYRYDKLRCQDVENDFDLPQDPTVSIAVIDFLFDAGFLTSQVSVNVKRTSYLFSNLAIRKGHELAG